MHFDLAAFFLLLTAAMGIVLAVDALFFRKMRLASGEPGGNKPREPVVVDYARSLFPVLLAVLAFRSFIAEPFRIPSGSMMPTLDVGDFILVNKFAYGLRLPVVHTKIQSIGQPRRGDVVVFRPPWAPGQKWIKRVIGLPGDTVTIEGEQVYVNGKQIPTTLVGPYKGNNGNDSAMLEASGALVYRQTLGRYRNDLAEMPQIIHVGTYQEPGCRFITSQQGSCRVPPRAVFVMGDDRDNSADSRFHGCVPMQDLVGKAEMIWFSWDGLSRGIAWHRMGTRI